MQSKEMISMQQLEMCNCAFAWGHGTGNMRLPSDLACYPPLAGWVTCWEASQETTAPTNDSVGGSDSSESEPSPRCSSCQGSMALLRCSGLGRYGILRTSGVHLQREMLFLTSDQGAGARKAADITQWLFLFLSQALESYGSFLYQVTWNLEAHSSFLPGVSRLPPSYELWTWNIKL